MAPFYQRWGMGGKVSPGQIKPEGQRPIVDTDLELGVGADDAYPRVVCGAKLQRRTMHEIRIQRHPPL